MLASLLNDVRYAMRGFARRPLFAAVVVVTLAAGIGVNVAMFSIFDQVLLRPLPAHEPERLVNLSSPSLGKGSSSCNNAGDCNSVFSYPMFRDLERSDGPFTGIAAHRYFDATILYGEQSHAGYAMLVSGSYFPVLGLTPALGRLLGPDDDAAEGEAAAVVLSHEYWRSALGADPSVIGKTLVVNGKPLAIVGVVPEQFHGTTIGGHADVYVPITFRWRANANVDPSDSRARRWVYLFARLKPGVSIAQAAAAINPVYHAILSDIEAPILEGFSEQDLVAFRGKTIKLEAGARGQSAVRGMARSPLTLLIVATSLVLLICCVNVANLMLVRASSRAGEIAVRGSLGASPLRIAALLAVEVFVLAALGAVASVPVTVAALRGIQAFVPAWAAGTFGVRLDSNVLAITVVFAIASAALFGFWPALKLTRTLSVQTLRTEGTRTTTSKAAARFQAALTTGQIGLSMTLLILAGWLAHSLVNANRVDLGIRTDSLVTFEVAPARNGYTPPRAAELLDRLTGRLAALPGVSSVASGTVGLLQSTNWDANVAVEGVESPPGIDANVSTNYVSPGFFSTLEMPLLSGRDFTAADSGDRPKVAIVNERFLDKFGLDRNAVGKRMSFGQGGSLDIEIVGVVRNAKYSEIKTPTPAQVFAPLAQPTANSSLSFYIRSGLDALTLRKDVERALAEIDRSLPLVDFRTMQDVVRENLFVDRFMSLLAVVLAGLATLLASLGVYGVLSYGVVERTREIGLRLALGAPPHRLRSMVLKQVAAMAAIGGALGLAGALLLGRAVRSLLFELSPSDPLVLSVAVLALGAVVLAAGYLPARRASRIDPMVALRSE